jgi:sulfite reductase alpha subunit-like flavoprotein
MVVDSDADEKFDLALPEELNDLIPTVLENRTSHLLLVLCCSSTGAGELPPNASKFYDALLGTKVINVDFVILCLGDSNYSSFMEAPHKLTKLEHLSRLVRIWCLLYTKLTIRRLPLSAT